MTKIIAYSLDYDGCGDIFSDQLLKDQYEGKQDKFFLPLRQKLNQFLDDKAQEAKEVELYVGSNRQSQELDEGNALKHKNGSCFTNFQKLCRDKTQAGKIWRFRPLLLGEWDASKIAILKNQLLDIEHNHPKDEVDFYFFDDDANQEILPGLKTYFEKEENAKLISKNIHLHFVKFDWFGEIVEGNKTLSEVAHIQGMKEPIDIAQPVTKRPLLHSSVYKSGPTLFKSAANSLPATTPDLLPYDPIAFRFCF